MAPRRRPANKSSSTKPPATGRGDASLAASPTPNGEPEGIELVFGLVSPTGVDLGQVFESLRNQLKAVNYKVEVVRVSELITPYLRGTQGVFASEYDRIRALMEDGTTLRELTDQKDVVGRLGVAKIRDIRKATTGAAEKAASKSAYIVSSFKRPEEVELFRQIYGKAFTLISVYSPKQSRIDDLARRLRPSLKKPKQATELAVQLIERRVTFTGSFTASRCGSTGL